MEVVDATTGEKASNKEAGEDLEVNDEDIPSGNRGDEGVLEGITIKDSDEASTDSEDDEEGYVIHAGRKTGTLQRRYNNFDRGARSYVRPQSFATPVKGGPESAMSPEALRSTIPEEIRKLRFGHHRTAFDVDIDTLEAQPWRNKNADISDYFNYGLNETTWKKYCEEQLKLRHRKGLGPSTIVPSVPAAEAARLSAATFATIENLSTAATATILPAPSQLAPSVARKPFAQPSTSTGAAPVQAEAPFVAQPKSLAPPMPPPLPPRGPPPPSRPSLSAGPPLPPQPPQHQVGHLAPPMPPMAPVPPMGMFSAPATQYGYPTMQMHGMVPGYHAAGFFVPPQPGSAMPPMDVEAENRWGRDRFEANEAGEREQDYESTRSSRRNDFRHHPRDNRIGGNDTIAGTEERSHERRHDRDVSSNRSREDNSRRDGDGGSTDVERTARRSSRERDRDRDKDTHAREPKISSSSTRERSRDRERVRERDRDKGRDSERERDRRRESRDDDGDKSKHRDADRDHGRDRRSDRSSKEGRSR